MIFLSPLSACRVAVFACQLFFVFRSASYPLVLANVVPILVPLCLGCCFFWASLPDLFQVPVLELISTPTPFSHPSGIDVGSLRGSLNAAMGRRFRPRSLHCPGPQPVPAAAVMVTAVRLLHCLSEERESLFTGKRKKKKQLSERK